MSSVNPPRPHLNESIREVSGNTWLISNSFLLTRSSLPAPNNIPTEQACWSDGTGGDFVLSPAPEPLPDSRSLAENSTCISRVHAVDNLAAVWQAGEAFIKAHHMDYPNVTREHVTLQFLRDQQVQGFDFPNVHHHFEADSRYFIIVSRVPGQPLDKAWQNLDEAKRQLYVDKVADICNNLAKLKGQRICGVDGHQLLERYLIKGGGRNADDLSPENLLQNCTEMGMDVSQLVFHHCDLGPTNLLVDPTTGSIGIVDWELAGYVPMEWVRTKFRLSAGMDFSHGEDDYKRSWRRSVAQRLDKMGYMDVVDAWWKFQDSK
ncbi:protein kinase-like protein [Pochonia chlamydosporia 170]|uniref:Protein kinase-like protein n=1 Tax=Pochonia chlamydosporia 170 TaxID=1380566 RepID=A0A179FXP0_METCM|nr:protein kinase-like protein [Pochonia chlamydosporia 170]OAQ69813.1 protein kinase-like protein [Pochonia chlamydosporia 170]